MKQLKIFLVRNLLSEFVGSLILKIYGDRIPYKIFGRRIKVDEKISNRVVASIFWGFYESTEIKFLNRYFSGSRDVIELGSSIGVVASYLKQGDGSKLICVEADSDLIPLLRQNLNVHKGHGYKIENAAVWSREGYINFRKGVDSISGNIATVDTTGTQKVPTLSLSNVIRKYKISDFDLICDIEGAEVDLVINDQNALENCNFLLLEAHQVKHSSRTYSWSSVVKLFTDAGFILIEQQGPVVLMRRQIKNDQ